MSKDEDLKFECGWWLPGGDTHLVETMKHGNKIYKNRYTYQYNKFSLGLNFIPPEKRRTALDIGSNIGTWTYNLVDYFDFIHCFEPVDTHNVCWRRNLKDYTNIKLHPVALGNEEKNIDMYIPDVCNAGAYIIGEENYAKFDGPRTKGRTIEDIQIMRLDDYNFENVDFMKIDVEGYELEVLKGAEKTISKNNPYIILEQKAENLDAVILLKNMGMNTIWSLDGDYFMGWNTVTEQEHLVTMRKIGIDADHFRYV